MQGCVDEWREMVAEMLNLLRGRRSKSKERWKKKREEWRSETQKITKMSVVVNRIENVCPYRRCSIEHKKKGFWSSVPHHFPIAPPSRIFFFFFTCIQ